MAKTSKKNNDKENVNDNPSLKAYQNMVDGLVGFAQLGAKEKCTSMIPTGHFRLDFALAYGKLPDNIDLNSVKDYDPDKVCGFPLGKVTEIFGVEGGGKTSLAYRIVGYAQKMGYPALWIDAERSFKENLAELNGIDIDTLAYSNLIDQDKGEKIFTAEAVFDNIIKACNSGFKVIVLDSIPALIPKSEMEKDLDDTQEMALLARVLSRSLPKVVNAAHKNDALIILINQIREKPGVMYGNPEVRPGGRALKYYASLVLSVKKSYGSSGVRLLVRTDENGVEEVIGGYSEVKVEKTRLAPPLLDKNGKKIPVEFPVYYKPYFPDIAEQVFDVGRSLKIISVRKGVYTWNEVKVEGKAEFIAEIKEQGLLNALANEIETKAEESNFLLPPELTQALMEGDLEFHQEEPIKVKEQDDGTSSDIGSSGEDAGLSEDE